MQFVALAANLVFFTGLKAGNGIYVMDEVYIIIKCYINCYIQHAY